MDRYPSLLKFLVVFLTVLHTLAGGPLYCCAQGHRPETDRKDIECGHVADAFLMLCHSHHHDHAYHAMNASPDSICRRCQDDPCHHVCDGGDFQAICPSRNVDETWEHFLISSSFSVVTVPVTLQAVSIGYQDAVPISSSALPLRLHLLYGLLLI